MEEIIKQFKFINIPKPGIGLLNNKTLDASPLGAT